MSLLTGPICKTNPLWWIFKRGGYGVHSPFIFQLITDVIEENRPYYCYDDIELVRSEFLFREEMIEIRDKKNPNRILTKPISEIVLKQGLRKKLGFLLFRIANFFKSKQIVEIGSGAGFSTLYLTAYAPNVHSTVLERDPALAHVAKEVYQKAVRTPVELHVGDYLQELRKLSGERKADLILFNDCKERKQYKELFPETLKMVHDGSVIIFEQIRADRKMYHFWKKAANAEGVTAALDLWSVGILLFDKHIHKKKYKIYF